jgi:type IV secretion system protein VirD4
MLVLFGLLLASALAALAATTAAALFLVINKVNPAQARPWSLWDYWQWYAPEPMQKKRLVGSMAVAGGVCFVALPLAVAGGLRRRRPLHGAARFATPQEVQAAGLFGGKGIIVGRLGKRFLSLPGQLFVLLAAPTRRGKDVAVVVPNLLAYPDSVVVNDLKGELWQKTSGFRREHGQAVYCFAPFAEDSRTHRYNPLGYVRNDARFRVADLLAIGQVLYPNDGQSMGSEGFFNDQARNLFLALGLYLLDTPAMPRTIGQMLRVASSVGKPLRDHLGEVMTQRASTDKALAGDTCEALSRFLSNPDNTLGSILSTFNAPLNLFADPLVDLATSDNDFLLSDVRRCRMSVYIHVPPNRLKDARLLVNLFFTQVVYLNTMQRPEENAELNVECLLVLNEFTSLGRVSILAESIGYIAGYGLRLLTVVQSMAQLAAVYGDKLARNFAVNHALRILFAPSEQDDAEEYSKMLGTFTEQAESRSRNRSHGLKGGGSSSGTTVSDQRRPLLLPQEFKQLGMDKQVVLFDEKCLPILADKIRYWDDPLFTPRLLGAAVLPQLDFGLHRAKVEQRTRIVGDDEPDAIDVSRLAHDMSDLPPIDDPSSDEEMRRFVDAFFARLETAPPPPSPAAEGAIATAIEAPDADVDLSVLEVER